MAAWDAPLGVGWDAARDAGMLAWAVAEAAKPGRAPGERWVLQAAAAWSAEHLEDEPELVLGALLEGFRAAVGLTRCRGRSTSPPTAGATRSRARRSGSPPSPRARRGLRGLVRRPRRGRGGGLGPGRGGTRGRRARRRAG
jgi:hypothetical protein